MSRLHGHAAAADGGRRRPGSRGWAPDRLPAIGSRDLLAGLIIGGGCVFLASKGEDVELPAGTPLIVRLDETVSVPATR